MSEKQEQDRATSRKAYAKQSAKQTLGAYNSRLHCQATIVKRLRLYLSSVRLTHKNGALYSYNRKDVSGGIGSVILGSCLEIAWTP